MCAVAALALASCGGPSVDDYRSDANEICRDFDRRGDEVAQPRDVEDLEPFLRDISALFDEFSTEFDDLDVPDELEDDHDRFVAINREARDRIRRIEAESLPEAERRFGEVFEPLETRVDELAADLGLDDCRPRGSSRS